MTPIRRQYLDVKRRYPDAIVLFRLGDFYETFDADATLCAEELNLTLTSRPLGKGQRIPMAGIPHHALAGYLRRLVSAGHRVAICEQVGSPTGRGLVERAVSRVVTPGTVLTDDLLQGVENNYLAALWPGDERIGLAYADVSTGEFATTQLAQDDLTAELARLNVREVVLPPGREPPSDWHGTVSRAAAVIDAERTVLEQMGGSTLAAYGLDRQPLALHATATLLTYLADTQPRIVALLTRLRTYDRRETMLLDAHTVRNLELFAAARSGERGTSLRATLDRTRTAMGGRLWRAQLAAPLLDVAAISCRLDAVAFFVERPSLRAAVQEALATVPDLERGVTRAAAAAATPRDLAQMRAGLVAVASVGCLLSGESSTLPSVPDCADVQRLIAETLADDPPLSLDAGEVIRAGFDPELDEVRALARDGRAMVARLEGRERERTGIKSLRVTYNRVFGYAIEVTNANLRAVPAEYQRRQTLAGGERYVTAELRELENRITGAQERGAALETEQFRHLCARVAAHAAAIRDASVAIARIDLAASHAETAALRGFCRPVVDDGDVIEIRAGRHPVVEDALPAGQFVPNDTHLSTHDQISILTGPNMAGKSTYLRQVALICLLAQVGSYVPAESARVGIVDRIFTRVGAQDDLAAGNSTFMVEMVETAHILHHATPRSLVILDEVGRGTSTHDGLAIARAIVEYLHNSPTVRARTLFATHYHELTALATHLPRVHNLSVAIHEQDGDVIFLRRIVPGGADRSYGVHVAQLAGMPRSVVQRAVEVLQELESSRPVSDRPRRARVESSPQLPLFGVTPPLLQELARLDVDALSPLDALTQLYELRRRARDASGFGGSQV